MNAPASPGDRYPGIRPHVGWYIHHHGAGHITRFRAVRPHLDAVVTVFSSLPRPEWLDGDGLSATEWVTLDRDDASFTSEGRDVLLESGDPTAQGLLHWAPIGHPGHASRLATIAQRIADARADRIADARFAAFVVDVSVEVTLLVRLLGVPVVVVTQPGDRSDAPHELAYRAAHRILAPWPATIPLAAALSAFAPKVRRVGGISRFDGRGRIGRRIPGRVLVFGALDDLPDWEQLRGLEHEGGLDIHVIGPPWIDDPWAEICASEIVITGAGQNAIADIAAAGSRAIVVPQARPFDEQLATADRIAEWELAVVEDARIVNGGWAGALVRARRLVPDWTVWEITGAAAQAAEVIMETVVETAVETHP